jgi:hypothetical protein
LREFIDTNLKEKLRLKNPSIESQSKGLLYIPGPQSLEEKHHFKLDMNFKQLIDAGHIAGDADEVFEITDPTIATALYARLIFDK